mmetsp:Transcript_12122/g.52252  ORF Transcript_12122/g.52252 Transcript_12122/m.52252 type:complete len:223 (-) Transcript_12122:1530-2198(-)
MAPVVNHHLRRGRVGYFTRAILLLGTRQVPAANRVVADAVDLVLLPAGDEHRVDGTKRALVVNDMQAASLAHEDVLPVPILLTEKQVEHRGPDHVLVGNFPCQCHGPCVKHAPIQRFDGCALGNLIELHARVDLDPLSLVILLPGDERLDMLGPSPGRGGGQVGVLCQLVQRVEELEIALAPAKDSPLELARPTLRGGDVFAVMLTFSRQRMIPGRLPIVSL